MKITILIVSIIGLMFVGCDENPAASTPILIEGTYSMTDAIMYETADCSGTPITGMCTTADVNTEATCPSGMCMDQESTTEAACPAGMWYTGMCHTDEDASTEATCPSGGWMTFGWITNAEYIVISGSGESESITVAGGVITYPEGIPGTYTISGTTISITDPAGCWDYGQEVAVDVATEAACDEAGSEWEEASIISGTLNVDGTVSLDVTEPAGCYDDEEEDVDAATEAACDEVGGNWSSTGFCTNMVFTLSTGQ